MNASLAPRPRTVVIGGGFAGLYAARGLARVDVDVLLIDQRNYHLFQPLLYQVAIGGLAPSDVASPLRWILRKQRNLDVWLATLRDVLPQDQLIEVEFANGRREKIAYDRLIVATGAQHTYFGHNDWAESAPGLKTLRDATEMRARILRAFELADRTADPQLRQAWLTFAVVGGGPTGVELAGALAELARDTLRRDFKHTDLSSTRVLLIEGSERILMPFKPELSEAACRDLEQLGAEVLTGAKVTEITSEQVVFERNGERTLVACRTTLWAAGVQGSEVGKLIAQRTGVELDRSGRVPVGSDFTVAGHPAIRVIGDLARYEMQPGKLLPGVAPAAMQAGQFVARDIDDQLRGKRRQTFRYRDKGNLATIGRSSAVAQFGQRGFSGFPAWLLWLFVHLMYLVGFANRVIVLFKWAVAYFTFNRGARLILPAEPHPRDKSAASP